MHQRLLDRLALGLGIGVILFSISSLSYQSLTKSFWSDETDSIMISCADSSSHLLVHGARFQCSAAPLFYLFQKGLHFFIAPESSQILLTYRLVSLISAFLLLVALFVWSLRKMGAGFAFLALAMMLNQPIFIYYSIEIKPYMSWLLFLFFSLVLSVESKQDSKIPFVVLMLVNFFLVLVASPGFMQSWALFLSPWIFFKKAHLKKREWLLLAILAGIGTVYAMNPCPVRGVTQVSDLWSSLFLLTAQPDAPARTYLLNALLVVGLSVPFINDKYLKNIGWAKPLAEKLWALLILSAFIVALVVWKDFYLHQRNFIYLILIRALGIALGGVVVAQAIRERLKLNPKWVPAVICILGALSLVPSLIRLGHAFDLRPYTDLSDPERSKEPCQVLEGTFYVSAPRTWHSEHHFNFFTRVFEEAQRCHWRAGPKPIVIFAKNLEASTNWYGISSDTPPGHEILEILGKRAKVVPDRH